MEDRWEVDEEKEKEVYKNTETITFKRKNIHRGG